MAIRRWTPPPPSMARSVGLEVLVALADLQRHLDVLGDDLVAADHALAAWQGHAHTAFRARLGHDLDRLDRLLAALGASRTRLAAEVATQPPAPAP